MAQYSDNKKYHSVKSVYLTAEQAEVFAASLELIAAAIEAGDTVRLKQKGARVLVKIPPATALRNQAGWLRRILSEQNGGYRLVTAWDYQEER